MSNSFSSNSDVEDFYDAEDNSPKRRHFSLTSLTSVDIDVEEEERKIIQDKKDLEERRRLEDEALQKRLLYIQQKKQRKLERQKIKEIEARKIAEENAQRRLKLHCARNIIADDSSPIHTTGDVLKRDLENETETLINSDFINNRTIFHSCLDLDKDDNSNKDLYRNVIQSGHFSDSESDSSEESEDNESIQSLLDREGCPNMNIDLAVDNLQKLQSKIIPFSNDYVESSYFNDEIGGNENIHKTGTLDPKEPDIVQCARNSVSDYIFNPIAPPRKKKEISRSYQFYR